MKLAIENYVSPKTGDWFARAAWSLLAFAVCLWFGAMIAAPVFKANDFAWAANIIYSFFSYLCHQEDARSFHIHGLPFAVCARCLGVYAGLCAGVLVYPLLRSLNDLEPLPRVWLLFAPVPTTVDFLLSQFGVWENTHWSRFVTAAILGVGLAFFLVPGAIEISRFFIQHITLNTYQKADK